MMKKKIFYTFFTAILAFVGSVYASNDTIYRVDPPNWWTGMEWNEVQLMVYGKNIGKYKLNIQSREVELAGYKKTDNPNYVFVKLRIKENAKPGKLQLKFFKGINKRIHYDYEIKERTPNEYIRKGLRESDLIYLIMPDRFANGNPDNDTIAGMLENEIDRNGLKSRHGGDIQGVLDKMDYFEEISIGALWLNPIFTNDQPKESYHGYAITDHYQVDPRLGGIDDYKKLIDESHKRGIKVVKDIIHNHVGDQHFFIKDLPSEDWINQWDEFTRTTYRATTLLDPYASDYDKRVFSDGWFDKHMPDLNQRNEEVKNYLIQNHIWWAEECKIDAYRIDTYAYPDQEFMAEWAAAIKKEFPYLGIFGETWVHGAGVQSWFVENAPNKELNSNLSSVTDFQLYYAINDALNQEQGWTEGVSKIYYALAKDYLYENPFKNVIFLDNHDLNRVFSVVNNDVRKMKMALTFLLTSRGIPQLYYGTEIGLDGFTDPNDGVIRQNFPGGWPGDAVNKFDRDNLNDTEKEIFDHYRAMALYRRKNSVLHDGELKHFVPVDGIYTYFRSKRSMRVMVNMNFSDKEKIISLSPYEEMFFNFGAMKNVLTGEIIENPKNIKLPPYTSMVWELVPLPKDERKIR